MGAPKTLSTVKSLLSQQPMNPQGMVCLLWLNQNFRIFLIFFVISFCLNILFFDFDFRLLFLGDVRLRGSVWPCPPARGSFWVSPSLCIFFNTLQKPFFFLILIHTKRTRDTHKSVLFHNILDILFANFTNIVTFELFVHSIDMLVYIDCAFTTKWAFNFAFLNPMFSMSFHQV